MKLSELHELVDNLENQNMTDEDYDVALIDTGTWTVYRIEECYANNNKGEKMLSITFDSGKSVANE